MTPVLRLGANRDKVVPPRAIAATRLAAKYRTPTLTCEIV
jgi:hypothetical protein